MTSQKIKFYKLNSNSSKLANAKTIEGAIIFVVDAKELWIGGETPKLVLKGTNEVTYNNNVLTITTWDNAGRTQSQTLDFSDVASAGATLKVFEKMFNLMGTTNDSGIQTIDYSGTNYLSELGTEGNPAKNLINADKALDTAIYNNSLMGADSAAQYNTKHLSSTWASVVNTNAVKATDTVKAGVEKVDKKVARLADEVIINEEVTQKAFAAVANSVGLEQDMSLDLKDASLQIIKDDTSVKKALIDLDNYVATKAGKVDDVKINGTTIVSEKIANIAVQGTYDASTNKIATEDTVKGAINALDVTTDTGAASVSGSTITINAVQQENGLIKNGGSTTINLDGTYNATDNKIATQNTVKNAIDAIAGAGLAVDNAGAITATTQQTSDKTTNVATTEFVHNVVDTLDGSATIASVANDVVTIKTGVTETNGVISNDSGTDIVLNKVAVTGNASDVAYSNSQSQMSAQNVQAAIDALDTRLDSLEGDFNIVISTDAATTPQGVKWMDGSTEITGTLQPGVDTYHDIYLVPAGGSEGSNTYKEYITTRTNTGTEQAPVYVYGWEKLGDIAVDLTGYVKSVTVNGKQYTVGTDSTNITLTDVITAITGENAIASGNTDFVKVTATTAKTEADGTNITALSTTAKVQAVASAGASNQGLAEASDVKAYVDGEIQKLDTTEYQQASVEVDTTNHVSTLKIKGIQETDGKIAAATKTPTTDVAIDGEYDETSNKIATQSTVSGIVKGLDVDDYKQATVDTATAGQTSITIKGIKEVDGKIGASASAQNTTIVADGTYNETDNKLATQSTVTNAINGLDASITSDDAAVATVKVVETDGKITDVVVTNTSAGVNYTASTASKAADLTASTGTGAVTGADIATIKSYVDDKSAMCWEEYE